MVLEILPVLKGFDGKRDTGNTTRTLHKVICRQERIGRGSKGFNAYHEYRWGRFYPNALCKLFCFLPVHWFIPFSTVPNITTMFICTGEKSQRVRKLF